MSSQKACRDFDALLSAYVDHEATADEMAIVETHTQSCAACASRLNQYATLVPRLEANIRAVLFEAEVAGARVEHTRFRDVTERLNHGASPVRLLSRAATLVFIVAMAFVAAAILARTAPAVQSLAVTTGAQPSPPATPATLNLPTSSSPSAPVLVASVNGLVDPAVAAYLHRAVSAADESHASALVIVLDASGGLDVPMQQVAEDLAGSSAPTLAFIAPGQANTADTLLAQSSGLVAATTTPDVEAFLRSVDGQTVQTAAGPVTLATASAPITTFEMEPLEAIAHRLLDPTTAYLLFVARSVRRARRAGPPGVVGAGRDRRRVSHAGIHRLRRAAHELAWRGGDRRCGWAHGGRAQGGNARSAGTGWSRVPDRRLPVALRRARFCTADTHRGLHRPGRAGWDGRQRAHRWLVAGAHRPTNPRRCPRCSARNS